MLVLVTRRPGTAGPLTAGGRAVEVALRWRETPTGRLFAHWLGARAVEPEVATFVHGPRRAASRLGASSWRSPCGRT